MKDHTVDVVETGTRGAREIELQLLALDLAECTRCVGSLANIERAVAAIQEILLLRGVNVSVSKIVIESLDQAEAYHFASSPTIRIDGYDILPELEESLCDSCSESCGCAEGVSCRLWRYEGESYTEAPVGLIVDALLQRLDGRPLPGAAPRFTGVPDNLKRFFAAKDAAPVADNCCEPEQRATCCEPEQRATCCRPDEPGACGCQ